MVGLLAGLDDTDSRMRGDENFRFLSITTAICPYPKKIMAAVQFTHERYIFKSTYLYVDGTSTNIAPDGRLGKPILEDILEQING